jgi:hypothetical protein
MQPEQTQQRCSMACLALTLNGQPASVPLDAGTRLASLQDAQDYVRSKLGVGWCGWTEGTPLIEFLGPIGTGLTEQPQGEA